MGERERGKPGGRGSGCGGLGGGKGGTEGETLGDTDINKETNMQVLWVSPVYSGLVAVCSTSWPSRPPHAHPLPAAFTPTPPRSSPNAPPFHPFLPPQSYTDFRITTLPSRSKSVVCVVCSFSFARISWTSISLCNFGFFIIPRSVVLCNHWRGHGLHCRLLAVLRIIVS